MNVDAESIDNYHQHNAEDSNKEKILKPFRLLFFFAAGELYVGSENYTASCGQRRDSCGKRGVNNGGQHLHDIDIAAEFLKNTGDSRNESRHDNTCCGAEPRHDAEKVVTNGLRTYCRLMCGKQKHHISLPVQSEPDEDGLSMEQLSSEDNTLDKLLEEQDICMLLQNCKRQYTGTARLGIEAIEWKVKGLSGAEIAKMYGVKPNLVGAWISRAAGRLKQNRDFMQYFDRPVEMDSS